MIINSINMIQAQHIDRKGSRDNVCFIWTLLVHHIYWVTTHCVKFLLQKGSRGYETFLLLSLANHVILNAHKIKMSTNAAFLGSDKPRILFFLLINVKMPTRVGILTFMSRKNSCLAELRIKFFYNLGGWFSHSFPTVTRQ